MLKLLTINDIEIPDPEGSLSVKKNNEYNEYDCTNDKITATYELAKRCDNITRCSC